MLSYDIMAGLLPRPALAPGRGTLSRAVDASRGYPCQGVHRGLFVTLISTVFAELDSHRQNKLMLASVFSKGMFPRPRSLKERSVEHRVSIYLSIYLSIYDYIYIYIYIYTYIYTYIYITRVYK